MAEFRDMSVAYTESEIQQIIENCRRFKSFDGTSVAADDIGQVCKEMQFGLTPQQLKIYIAFYKKHLNGRLVLEGTGGLEEVLHRIHSVRLLAELFAQATDKNQDGVISREEFLDTYDMLVTYFPNLSGRTYDAFVCEADRDVSGDVSVAELVEWIAKDN